MRSIVARGPVSPSVVVCTRTHAWRLSFLWRGLYAEQLRYWFCMFVFPSLDEAGEPSGDWDPLKARPNCVEWDDPLLRNVFAPGSAQRHFLVLTMDEVTHDVGVAVDRVLLHVGLPQLYGTFADAAAARSASSTTVAAAAAASRERTQAIHKNEGSYEVSVTNKTIVSRRNRVHARRVVWQSRAPWLRADSSADTRAHESRGTRDMACRSLSRETGSVRGSGGPRPRAAADDGWLRRVTQVRVCVRARVPRLGSHARGV